MSNITEPLVETLEGSLHIPEPPGRSEGAGQVAEGAVPGQFRKEWDGEWAKSGRGLREEGRSQWQ